MRWHWPSAKQALWVAPLVALLAWQLALWLLLVWLAAWLLWNLPRRRWARWALNAAVLTVCMLAPLAVGPLKSAECQTAFLLLLSALLVPNPLCALAVPSWQRPQGISLVVFVFLTGALFLFTRQFVVLFAACIWVVAYVGWTIFAAHGVRWGELRIPKVRLLGYGLASAMLAGVIFAVIPRIPMGVAAPITFAQGQARSGVSESLEVDRLGSVTLDPTSDYVIRFQAGAPPAEAYWRVHVLEQWDGARWTKAADGAVWGGAAAGRPDAIYEAQPMRPGLALQVPVLGWRLGRPPDNVSLGEPMPVAAAFEPPAEEQARLRLLRHAQVPSTQLGRWAVEDRARHASDLEWVQSIQSRFVESFRYSLTPPAGQGASALDAFFFDHRQGYCAHFTAAMAEMLRVNGIPVRVVSGYIGTDFNASGGFWILRRSQAHLWLEAVLDGGGLYRLDPTKGVMPLPGVVPPQESAGRGPLVGGTLQHLPVVRALMYRLEAMDVQISNQILSFGYERIQSGAGLAGQLTSQTALWMVGFFALCLALVYLVSLGWSALWQPQSMSARLSRQLERCAGLARRPGETLTDYMVRAVVAPSPELMALLHDCLAADFGPRGAWAPKDRRALHRRIRKVDKLDHLV